MIDTVLVVLDSLAALATRYDRGDMVLAYAGMGIMAFLAGGFVVSVLLSIFRLVQMWMQWERGGVVEYSVLSSSRPRRRVRRDRHDNHEDDVVAVYVQKRHLNQLVTDLTASKSDDNQE